MMRILLVLFAFLFVLTGCTSNLGSVKEDMLGNVENIDAMEEFVQKMKENDKAKITVLSTGIEGQDGMDVLTFNGIEITVTRTVDEEFIEELSCSGVEIEKKADSKVYILQECSSESMTEPIDFPILSGKG
ncbi:hypothetical protein FZW96_14495 [Bacillus sp. BGMRC 2118]|nr:hypothetical protein FZW96_14495 [Bacillus sp. BGMRC 2118]